MYVLCAAGLRKMGCDQHQHLSTRTRELRAGCGLVSWMAAAAAATAAAAVLAASWSGAGAERHPVGWVPAHPAGFLSNVKSRDVQEVHRATLWPIWGPESHPVSA